MDHTGLNKLVKLLGKGSFRKPSPKLTFPFSYCVIKVRGIVQHKELENLESPCLELVITVAPERSIVQQSILQPGVSVEGGDLILLGSIGLEEISDLLKTERVNPMSCSFVKGREVHSMGRESNSAVPRLSLSCWESRYPDNTGD